MRDRLRPRASGRDGATHRRWRGLLRLGVVLLALGVPAALDAQTCTRGKRCGNTCIARNRTCRIGTPSARPPSGADCSVARVVDGDTLDCADGRRIRLLLIDAPEMEQGAFGALAKQGLESLAPVGATLTLELDVRETDRYGRTLAHLYDAEERNLNLALLRMGLAVVAVYPPNVRHVDEYRAAVTRAREARIGLWAVSAFDCEPADFRAGRCGPIR